MAPLPIAVPVVGLLDIRGCSFLLEMLVANEEDEKRLGGNKLLPEVVLLRTVSNLNSQLLDLPTVPTQFPSEYFAT